MRKLVMCFLFITFSLNNYALQIKSVVDNETVSAKISSIDTTRIFVEGDRIKSVRGIKGAYERENDDEKGEIYITPRQSSAFTVLIETENARHFTLLLNPVSSPSDTLMLVPKGVGIKKAIRFENASDYQLTLTHLISAMSKGVLPEGYSLNEVDSKEVYSLGNIATLRLKTIYQGLAYQGEIFELTNTRSYPIKLDERSFFKAGTCAISFETIIVKPKGKIRVMRVVRHG